MNDTLSSDRSYILHCTALNLFHWMYDGESNENLKYFLSRKWLKTKGTQWLYFPTYFPLRFIQVFQPFGSACIILEKKIFWLRVQTLVHRLLHFFVGPERLSSHRLIELSKEMKVTGARSGEYGECERHSKDSLGLLQQLNGQYGTEHFDVGAKHLFRRPRRLDLIAGCRLFLRWSSYVVLVTVFHLGL